MFNLTLLIQGFNFWLAYVLLARFFFKPILDTIEKSALVEQNLHNSIAHCHTSLQAIYLLKQQLWQQTSSKFHTYINFGDKIYHKPQAHNPNLLSVDLEIEIDEQERVQLTQFLVRKIIDSK